MDWRKLREADAKLKEVSEPTRSKVFNCYNTVDDVEEDVVMDLESKDKKPRDQAVDLENLMKGPKGPREAAFSRRLEEKLKPLQSGERDPENLRRLAEEGKPEAAYTIGCLFSMRIAPQIESGEKPSSLLSPDDLLEKSVAETDEESFPSLPPRRVLLGDPPAPPPKRVLLGAPPAPPPKRVLLGDPPAHLLSSMRAMKQKLEGQMSW